MLGACLRAHHLNIEGISNAKSEIFFKLMEEEKVDVIVLLEMHAVNEADIHKRDQIPGYTLIGMIHHK